MRLAFITSLLIEEMTDDQRFERWSDWLSTVRKDVQNLTIGRHVYTEVRRIVRDNPSLHKASSFYDMLNTTFAAWAAMSVRRQQDGSGVSLAKLLNEVERHSGIVSRERFVRTYVAKMLARMPAASTSRTETETGGAYVPSESEVKHLANSEFDQLVGSGANHVNADTVKQERNGFYGVAKNLNDFADVRTALALENLLRFPLWMSSTGAPR